MQELIIVKPTYTGPRLIETYLKKAKGHSSLGRMISTFNKRWFVLDMNRLLFYYLPERDAILSNATAIPLDSISRIYVEHQAHVGTSEPNSKQSFVILTKKKAYKLLCDSQLVMEQLLFAFSNLVDAQSQKPLYDWNTYYTPQPQDNMPVDSQYKSSHIRSSSKGPSPVNKMNHQQPVIPQQRESSLFNMSQGPVRVNYNSEQQQQEVLVSPPETETNTRIKIGEMNRDGEAQNMLKLSSQKSEPEQPVQDQVSPTADEARTKDLQKEANSEVERSSSPGQRRSNSKENRQQTVQVRGRNMGQGQGLNLNPTQNLDNQVEVQSLDMPSKTNSEENKSTPALSSRQLQSLRRASSSRQKAGGVTPRNSSIPVSKVENVNAIPLKIGQDLTPSKFAKVSENFTSQFETAVSRPSREARESRDDREERPNREERSTRNNNSRSNLDAVPNKASTGGAESSGFSRHDEPRLEEITNQDMPISYLDIMKQKRKEKHNQQNASPSSKYEAKRQLDTEDDWDKELFGDGKISPLKTEKKFDDFGNNYNSQYISQPNQSSAQIPKLNEIIERKVGVPIKEKTQTFAGRGYVHNDWDDDL